MRRKTRFSLVSALLVALALALISCGKGKPSATAGANSISNKLAAVTQLGQPVTAKNLDDWYATPVDLSRWLARWRENVAPASPCSRPPPKNWRWP
jgi:hypothetical protein